MSKFYKYILSGVILACASNVWAADPTLKVNDVDVTVNENAKVVDLNLKLNLKDFKIGRNGEVIYTPVIVSKNGLDSIVMPAITVCGRNRYYYYKRNGLLENAGYSVYRSGAKETVNYSQTLPLQSWMLDDSMIEVRQQQANCCSSPKLVPGDLPDGNLAVARIKKDVPHLEYDYVFSPPMEQEPVSKSLEGKAFVTFVVNRTELDPNYMINPSEIQKITNSIDFVKNDPDAIITEVHIKGFASPEGPYQNNVRLAKGRTETLANYVNSLYNFKSGIMTTSYEPEDWGGLRAYVTDSLNYNLTDRMGLLSIIDSNLEYDARDAALKNQFPQDYQVILKEIYPWLRHSDYAVKYNIKVYTDMANLMRLYNTDPSKLRPVDFYTIAQQYPVGSPDYLAVMKKAVEVYPDHPMINLNVANIYLQEGDYDAAQSCLLKAGKTPQANYARGILAAKRGDYKEAQKWFEIADKEGISQAAVYLNQIKEVRNASPVDILIKTTK